MFGVIRFPPASSSLVNPAADARRGVWQQPVPRAPRHAAAGLLPGRPGAQHAPPVPHAAARCLALFFVCRFL